MINEGLIRVPKTVLDTLYSTASELMIGRLMSYYKDTTKDLTDEDIDILLDDLRDYVKTFKGNYKDVDYTKESFHKEYLFGKDALIIPSYPAPPNSILLSFSITFNNNKSSASFLEKGNNKALIQYNAQTHFRVMGKTETGEEVYTFNKNAFQRDLKSLKGAIRHELMHMVQLLYIEKEMSSQMQVDYYDSNDEVDIIKYFKSDIEFNPYLQSEISKFMNDFYYSGIETNKLKSLMREFISIDYNMGRTSAYFNILKNNSPKKYKKAVKIFFTEVQDIIKKGA